MSRLNTKTVCGIAGEYRPGGRPVSARTITNWIRAGLPCMKVGGTLSFDEKEVRRWVIRKFSRNATPAGIGIYDQPR